MKTERTVFRVMRAIVERGVDCEGKPSPKDDVARIVPALPEIYETADEALEAMWAAIAVDGPMVDSTWHVMAYRKRTR